MIRAKVKNLLSKRENPLPNVIQVNMKNEFIEDNNISCEEDVIQCDSINEQCADFVAELVGIIVDN